MQHDVEAPCAQRFANTNLARALGDAHQHNIHDHNSAHHQRDTRHRNHDRGNQRKNRIDKAANRFRREDVEPILFSRRLVEPGAQCNAAQIQALVKRQTRLGTRSSKHRHISRRRPEELVVSRDGHVDHIVLALPKRGAQLFK